MKIKEGAEKLREVSTDKKSLSNVSTIVKKANSKLQQLHQDLQDLNACLLLTNTVSQDTHHGMEPLIYLGRGWGGMEGGGVR
jgi:protein kinase N